MNELERAVDSASDRLTMNEWLLLHGETHQWDIALMLDGKFVEGISTRSVTVRWNPVTEAWYALNDTKWAVPEGHKVSATGWCAYLNGELIIIKPRHFGAVFSSETCARIPPRWWQINRYWRWWTRKPINPAYFTIVWSEPIAIFYDQLAKNRPF